jgi:hypothetical protein
MISDVERSGAPMKTLQSEGSIATQGVCCHKESDPINTGCIAFGKVTKDTLALKQLGTTIFIGSGDSSMQSSKDFG